LRARILTLLIGPHQRLFANAIRFLFFAAEDFAQHYVEVVERVGAVAGEAGAVHDGQRFRLEAGELLQILGSERRVIGRG
jgi:hypothetical protein